MKELIERLTEEKRKMQQTRRFFLEHKFQKEADFLQTKIEVLEQVLYGMEYVADGTKKANEIRFEF